MKSVIVGAIILLLTGSLGESVHAQGRVTSVVPSTAGQGGVVVINGQGFGTLDGRSRVRFFRTNDRLCQAPILDWTEERILVAVPLDCPRDVYQVQVYRPSQRSSNTDVLLRVTPVPPAIGVGQSAPPVSGGISPLVPLIRRTHPRLTLPGRAVDVYGDFAVPMALSAVLEGTNPPLRLVLKILERSTRHLRVWIPDSPAPAPGGYRLMIVRHPGHSSSQFIIIRAASPADWEHLIRGDGGLEVNIQIVALEPNSLQTYQGDPARVEEAARAKELDILGLNLGDQPGHKWVDVTTEAELRCMYRDVGASLRTCPLRSQTEHVINWSNTRVRIRTQRSPGTYKVVIWGVADPMESQKTIGIRSNALPLVIE